MRLKLTFSAITLFFVCSIAFIPQMILSRVTRVELTPVTSQTYQETVYCNGEIIEKNSREIYLETPVIASSVQVEVGDRVWCGQTLATVNTKLTQKVLEQGTPVSEPSLQNATMPIEIFALAQQYGLSEETVQAAMGRYSGLPIDNTLRSDAIIPERITAPIGGIVTAVNLQTDVLTQTSQPVITVSDDSAYAALVSVNEADIAKLSIGDFASVTGLGFGGEGCSGSVRRIHPTARKQLNGTTQQTVVDVELSLDEPNGQIRPGNSVKATIQTQDCGEILTLPYEAVGQDENNREYVYIYAQNHIQRRIVTTGRELTESVEIVSGLSFGEQVVLNPETVSNEAGLFLPEWQGGTL